jgi:hypothetical protein
MRKLSKTIVYATEYETWENSFGSKNQDKYSSSGKFQKDIIAELLIIQNGLCAYTEYRLMSNEDVETLKISFASGKFMGAVKDYPIDLEHFDSTLKNKYGWKWSNFFAVNTTINQKVKRRQESELIKSGKRVHYLMKPDLSTYDVLTLLDYDRDLDLFVPNSELKKDEFIKVKEMILCLGLNNAYIKDKRIIYYKELRFLQSIGESITLSQFHTGWEIMSLQ